MIYETGQHDSRSARRVRSHGRGRTLAIVGAVLAAGLTVGVVADAAAGNGGGMGNGAGGMGNGAGGMGNGGGAGQRTGDGSRGGTNGCSVDCVLGSTTSADLPASDVLSGVIVDAVTEERLALATYEMVIDEYGEHLPFTSIARSEARHVATLEELAARYGVDVDGIEPAAPATPASLDAAFDAAIALEIEDGALYDELTARLDAADEAADHPDVIRVFERLQTASLEHHLPALERAAS